MQIKDPLLHFYNSRSQKNQNCFQPWCLTDLYQFLRQFLGTYEEPRSAAASCRTHSWPGSLHSFFRNNWVINSILSTNNIRIVRSWPFIAFSFSYMYVTRLSYLKRRSCHLETLKSLPVPWNIFIFGCNHFLDPSSSTAWPALFGCIDWVDNVNWPP